MLFHVVGCVASAQKLLPEAPFYDRQQTMQFHAHVHMSRAQAKGSTIYHHLVFNLFKTNHLWTKNQVFTAHVIRDSVPVIIPSNENFVFKKGSRFDGLDLWINFTLNFNITRWFGPLHITINY